jgi:hypothetical protein
MLWLSFLTIPAGALICASVVCMLWRNHLHAIGWTYVGLTVALAAWALIQIGLVLTH